MMHFLFKPWKSQKCLNKPKLNIMAVSSSILNYSISIIIYIYFIVKYFNSAYVANSHWGRFDQQITKCTIWLIYYVPLKIASLTLSRRRLYRFQIRFLYYNLGRITKCSPQLLYLLGVIYTVYTPCIPWYRLKIFSSRFCSN